MRLAKQIDENQAAADTVQLMMASTFNGLCAIIAAMIRHGKLSAAEVHDIHDAMYWPLDDPEHFDDPVLTSARETVEAMLLEALAPRNACISRQARGTGRRT